MSYVLSKRSHVVSNAYSAEKLLTFLYVEGLTTEFGLALILLGAYMIYRIH